MSSFLKSDNFEHQVVEQGKVHTDSKEPPNKLYPTDDLSAQHNP